MANPQSSLSAANFSLSQRVSRISVSATQAVVMEAAKLRAQGASLVDFGAGEPDFFTPDNIKEAAIRAIRENFSKYTPAAGTAELRQAIVERHAADFGSSYVPAEVIATAGGKQAIFNLICSLVNPGDDVILPVPYWVTFCDCINYAGGHPVMLETRETENFALTAEMVQAAPHAPHAAGDCEFAVQPERSRHSAQGDGADFGSHRQPRRDAPLR